jgi:cell division protein FtsB
MSEVMILKLLDFSLTALSVGLERQVILDKVAEMQKAGATPDQLVEGVRKLRDDALAALQDAIHKAP